ncbi:hypothetical protein D3C72_1314300 [compost metagenome]
MRRLRRAGRLLLRQRCGSGGDDGKTGGGKKSARERGKTHGYLWDSNQCGYFDAIIRKKKPQGFNSSGVGRK